MSTLLTLVKNRNRLTTVPTSPMRRLAVASSLVVMAGIAVSFSLSACDQHSSSQADQTASHELKQAGSDLTAAAKETGAALNQEAQAAKPQLEHLGAKADEGVAKLADATGDAAHRAAEHAREHADNVEN